MKKKSSAQTTKVDLPVSKQTAGGVSGAVIGSAVAGPVGAVVGAVAGTIMGNRVAQGKSPVSESTVQTAKRAVKAVKDKVPSLRSVKAFAKTAAGKLKPATPKRPATKKPAATKSRAKKPAATKPAGKQSPTRATAKKLPAKSKRAGK